ncbi:MAG TPA: hypothetical protein VKU88_08415 [Acidimicrobiales bacterium]|nr:hypothetical protein [Acidimicrobiales bacterium]
MGKASSSKKVARAASIGGGRFRRRNTPWGYFAVIFVIIALGVVGTWASRDRRIAQINGQGNTPPTVGTVWNEGYAVYVCGHFLPAISTKSPDPQGITTRTPGIIDIDPTVKAAAGKNATLGKFASAVGMKLNAAELQVPGGKLYQDGDKCEGQPGHVYVKQFAYTGDRTGQVYDGAKNQLPKTDPSLIHLQNDAMVVIAFVPQSQVSKIPPPPSYVITNLNNLSASPTTTTTTPVASTSPPTTSKTATSPPTTAKG